MRTLWCQVLLTSRIVTSIGTRQWWCDRTTARVSASRNALVKARSTESQTTRHLDRTKLMKVTHSPKLSVSKLTLTLWPTQGTTKITAQSLAMVQLQLISTTTTRAQLSTTKTWWARYFKSSSQKTSKEIPLLTTICEAMLHGSGATRSQATCPVPTIRDKDQVLITGNKYRGPISTNMVPPWGKGSSTRDIWLSTTRIKILHTLSMASTRKQRTTKVAEGAGRTFWARSRLLISVSSSCLIRHKAYQVL